MRTYIIPRTCSMRLKILSICLCATNRMSLAINSQLPHGGEAETRRRAVGSGARGVVENFQLAAVAGALAAFALCHLPGAS